jgi:thiosulfate reductase/polysulfide reductase chain A
MGLEGSFWPNLRACLEDILKPSGMTYDDFRKVGILKGKWRYRSYEEKGFSTPSKKVEIFSERLKDWGYDPLPTDHGSIETKAQDGQISEVYPLILTSAKDPHYFHSAYRNLPSLRRLSPEPMVSIHPERAQALGIQEGDWVVIQTPRGSIRQRASLDPDLDPRVVIGAYGWWFPERKDLELSGWKESNINVLTDHQPPFDPAIGTTRLRAIPCRVLKD